MVCHGDSVRRAASSPICAGPRRPATKDGFAEVVLDGKYASAGMASFANTLSADDVEAVRAYIVNRANEDAAAIKAAAPTAEIALTTAAVRRCPKRPALFFIVRTPGRA